MDQNVSTAPTRPAVQLTTSRGLLKAILLNMITCGIYSWFEMSAISEDVNTVASRYDGRKTMHYLLMYFIVGPLTCGIGYLVWYHNISDRIGCELRRRNISYGFGAADYWLWCFLGSWLFGIGPFVYMYRLYKAMNLMNADYNARG